MRKYIVKFWKINCVSAILNIICSGEVVGLNLLMIRAMQGIIELNLYKFIRWMFLDLFLWILYISTDCVRAYFQNKAISKMNNDFRMDLVRNITNNSYQFFHEKDSGEYISWFTNDVSQVQRLAWEPFFEYIASIASIIFSAIALSRFHWSLLLVSFLAAFLIVAVPKIFSKSIERYGKERLFRGNGG